MLDLARVALLFLSFTFIMSSFVIAGPPQNPIKSLWNGGEIVPCDLILTTVDGSRSRIRYAYPFLGHSTPEFQGIAKSEFLPVIGKIFGGSRAEKIFALIKSRLVIMQKDELPPKAYIRGTTKDTWLISAQDLALALVQKRDGEGKDILVWLRSTFPPIKTTETITVQQIPSELKNTNPTNESD